MDARANGHARVSVSFAVQGHPQRTLDAQALADKIGGKVVWDPDPMGIRSPWRTFRHLFATTPPQATHRLQIQDDATPCPGFAQAVRRAVRAQPERLLVFYVGTQSSVQAQAILEACRRDRTWAELNNQSWVPVVSTCWPRALWEAMLEWTDEVAKKWPASYVADDEIVGRFLNASGHRPLASVPSLVDHLDEVPSIMGKRGRAEQGRARRAACWIGDCGDCARKIDWSLPVDR